MLDVVHGIEPFASFLTAFSRAPIIPPQLES